ncbi:MAG TPA: hypothetical protein VLR46_11595 [Candidatus Dormibacteraeota bacterium]|nr:hypothetical protein [Candidatus Dormibacteraeota bacterium]
MAYTRIAILLVLAAVVVSCGSGTSDVAKAATRQRVAVAVPALASALPPFATALGPVVASVAPPAAVVASSRGLVTFAHLTPAAYEVHLHAICSGQQGYHLAYLPQLVVGSAHTGSIQVPAADFGRGWCVIVYSDPVRSIVLTTRPI